MKKFIVTLMIAAMTSVVMAGCGSAPEAGSTSGSDGSTGTEANADDNKSDENNADDKQSGSGVSGMISVVSREDGSGTRGAFIELFGIEEKDDDGNKVDNTTVEAVVANSTEVVLSNVAGDPNAIGYVSMGSLNDNVNALKINGAEATVENIKSGDYEISRPFNIATKGTPSEVTQDFINYIQSSEGQKIVESSGYIQAVDAPEAFKSNQAKGKIVVAGSSSVAPVMEKLIEAYKAINTKAELELQQNDSSTGLQSTMDGTADIGMASRELKDSESELDASVIAIDGIAVITNKANTVDTLTTDEVKAIFTGETTTW